jgi:hypothetical protein
MIFNIKEVVLFSQVAILETALLTSGKSSFRNLPILVGI